VRELAARVDVVCAWNYRAIQECRFHFDLGARVKQLDASLDVRRAQIFMDRMIEYDRVRKGVAEYEHPIEESRQAPELILCPVLIRVVMALRAIQTKAQKDAHLFRHDFRGR